ncbi:MAG: serine hydrolase [Clostridia bacterium]|nr:serine hydrolase [Clostridia bacterium]
MTRERAILGFLDEMEGRGLHGFILTLNGEIISEGYCAPFAPEQMHRMYSVSKSVVSLAIGMLADEGRLSLDDRIVDHFPEYVNENTPALLREVTIRNMLMMSTCYDRAMYVPLEDEDWTKPFFYGMPTHPAGTLFHYDTSASQVMCALAEKLTGESILSLMQRRLFDRIGMDGDKQWLCDRAGTSQGGTGLSLTLRDFSKLANFCMSDGMGIVSEEYLRAATGWQIATEERSAPEERYGYGYQFWRMRRGFYMYGLGGQMALCLPEEGLCLCTTADMMLSSVGVQPIFDAFFRHLAGIGSLPACAEDAVLLDRRIASLHVPAVTGAAVRERIFVRLEQGGLPFDTLELLPDSIVFGIGALQYSLPCVPGIWSKGVFPTTNQNCITSGGFVADGRFILHCELCDDFVCGMEMIVSIKENRAALRISGALWECARGWNGLAWGRTD